MTTIPPTYDEIIEIADNLVNGLELKETVTYNLYGDDVLEEIHEYADEEADDVMIAVHHDPTAMDRYNRGDVYTRSGGGWSFMQSLTPMTDVRNNVVGLVDQEGDMILKIAYDLHGNAMYCVPNGPDWQCSADPQTLDAPQSLFNMLPYRFSGRRFDPETDLYYYRSRYYSPEMARFISIDTIGIWGDLNKGGYPLRSS